MKTTPLVSVLVPTFNRSTHVETSVRSVLAQDYAGELELIVVDNASTDDTAEVVSRIDDPRLRLVHEPHRGIGTALNCGLAQARGELIARNDDDDQWLPHLLSTLVPALMEVPDAVAAYGRARGIAADGTPLQELRGYPLRDPDNSLGSLLLSDTTSSITTVARADVLRELGGWSEANDANEDWDLAVRLATRGPLRFVDAEVAHFLRHDANTTVMRGDARMQERLLARRGILDRAYATLPPSDPAWSVREVAYRNVHIGEGHQWLQCGQPLRALSAYRRSLAHGGTAPTLARIAWTGAMWFGPEPLAALGDRALRMHRRLRGGHTRTEP